MDQSRGAAVDLDSARPIALSRGLSAHDRRDDDADFVRVFGRRLDGAQAPDQVKEAERKRRYDLLLGSIGD
jgi:hypothetical protein